MSCRYDRENRPIESRNVSRIITINLRGKLCSISKARKFCTHRSDTWTNLEIQGNSIVPDLEATVEINLSNVFRTCSIVIPGLRGKKYESYQFIRGINFEMLHLQILDRSCTRDDLYLLYTRFYSLISKELRMNHPLKTKIGRGSTCDRRTSTIQNRPSYYKSFQPTTIMGGIL